MHAKSWLGLAVCLCSGDLNEMKTFLRDFQADTIESLDLKYPDRLQLKPVKKSKDLQTDGTNADDNCDHLQAVAGKDVLFDSRLKGLPGELSLDIDTPQTSTSETSPAPSCLNAISGWGTRDRSHPRARRTIWRCSTSMLLKSI